MAAIAAPAEDNALPPPRTSTPPLHLTWAARLLTVPNFPAFSPKNIRVTSSPGQLTDVAWSCDGKRVVACGAEKLARVWTPEKSFEIRNTITLASAHTEIVDSCAWSPIAPDVLCTASSRDMRVVFWDASAKARSPTQTISLKPRQPTKLLFSPNGKTVLVLTRQGGVTILVSKLLPDGKEEWTVSPNKMKHNDSEVDLTSCVWNNTGAVIIAGDRGGHLTYYTYPELKRGPATGAHSGGATCLAMDPRGKYIATVGADSIVNLFDIVSWRVCNTLDCTEDVVNDIDFSYDGEFIAVAFARSLEIWSTETGERMHQVTQPVTPCKSVAWHPWKFVLAFGGQSYQGYQDGIASNRIQQAPGPTLSFFGI